MSLGKRLKELRNSKKITQDELAKILNKSRGSVAGYETDVHSPDLETMVKIAEYFNVSFDYLIGGHELNKKYLPKKYQDLDLAYLALTKDLQDADISIEDMRAILRALHNAKRVKKEQS